MSTRDLPEPGPEARDLLAKAVRRTCDGCQTLDAGTLAEPDRVLKLCRASIGQACRAYDGVEFTRGPL